MQGSDFWQPCAPPKSCRNQKSFWDPSTYHPNTTGLGWDFFISKKHVLVGHPNAYLHPWVVLFRVLLGLKNRANMDPKDRYRWHTSFAKSQKKIDKNIHFQTHTDVQFSPISQSLGGGDLYELARVVVPSQRIKQYRWTLVFVFDLYNIAGRLLCKSLFF